MRHILLSFGVAGAILFSGCGAPTIDATTESTMQESIGHIRSRLEAGEKAEFDAALSDLNDMLFKPTDAVSQATIGLYRPEALVRKILHRKNAREVISMVERRRRRLP